METALDFLRELNAALRGAAERLDDRFLDDLGTAETGCQFDRLRLALDTVR